jgi:hypothetical protein
MKYTLCLWALSVVMVCRGQNLEEAETNTSGQFYVHEDSQISWSLGQILVSTNPQLSTTLHYGNLQVLESKSPGVPFSLVYPNPTPSQLKVAVKVSHGEVRIKILKLNGQVILGQSLYSHEEETTLDLQNLPDGMYMLKIQDTRNQNINNYKIVKSQNL